MRRSLIVTVAAAVGMVLLAMLVPMAILMRDYALEDRLAAAALELQATESVVSGAGSDKGDVSVYVVRINETSDSVTTVLYPDGTGIGPQPGEDERVVQSRQTGQARVDDVDGGAQILVPVSLGGSSGGAADTPVVRVFVPEPSVFSGPTARAYLVLAGLGAVLLLGALLIADRVGRSFVQPIGRLATYAQTLGDRRTSPPAPSGPAEVRELGTALRRLVGRIELLLTRERETVADLSHRLRTPITSLRLRIEALPPGDDRARLSEDLDRLQVMVDHVVGEARRSEREGLVAGTPALAVLADRAAFWLPLAEDQGRTLTIDVPTGPDEEVHASEPDLAALVDVLLDNVFTHTPEGAGIAMTIARRAGGGVVLTVDDEGPGFPDDVDVVRRGASGADSSGLGLAIAHKTATESGGGLVVGASPAGGGRVVVDLGPPA
ncbi:sensor histidine kinase [Nocardioides currus]|uniref:Signal transduction histidine-protein kinase/phosphatase MprB n=1 Tax=Nocardioides currus TaxID=2133958 RepID=A0A2R7YRU4_9ACTN|nr:HAMP domain-containing sensor histidine kinase [Nocardioides currus]PUA79023.1 two-component sensor histidine kinase [Nocardioides currus]